MKRHVLLIAAVACCAAAASQAATIYRCGPAGNLYSDQPCMDGRVIAANDERSDAQRAEGLRIAAYDRHLAHELQRERLLQESAAPKLAANLGARPLPVMLRVVEVPRNKKSAKREGSALAGRDTDFVAYAPASIKSSRR